MSLPKNPFLKSTAEAGKGDVVVSLLPPYRQVLSRFTYQYPLKLITPDAHKILIEAQDGAGQTQEVSVTTIFLLTYGGGLLARDSIDLALTLSPSTRVALLTQGSTKIFKHSHKDANASTSTQTSSRPSVFSRSFADATRQTLAVRISPGASLCYLPDPNQPFADSVYEQRQTFYVDPSGSSSLLLLDWVSEGRKARGESWTLSSWKGRNEVREFDENGKGRLLIRDAVILENDDRISGQNLAVKTNGMGLLGTLIVYGPMYKSLSQFWMHEFQSLPRMGAKNWSTTYNHNEMQNGGIHEKKEDQNRGGLLWTAAQNRGFVVVKFGAKDLDAARQWLFTMLRKEGTVEREFGHQALLCLK